MFDLDNNTVSVSQLTQRIKSVLETDFTKVSVVGEISNYTAASSGHKYFTLKDNTSQISCVMWKSRPIKFQVENGMKVNLSGSITVYPPRGSYQLDVSSMQPQGIGDLYLAYEKLKNELLELGYFDNRIKKEWPLIPLKIGVSTSPTGAAIKDILSTLERRVPFAEVYFLPVNVQGTGSEIDIANAIKNLDTLDLDVIIIGRGGGSIEDLWSYNTRIVADAIFNATTPIVAGVGHETDTTIADLVADHRSPTPTGAAEIVSINTIDIIRQTLDEKLINMENILKNSLSNIKKDLDNFNHRINRSNIINSIENIKINLETLDRNINKSFKNNIERKKNELESLNKIILKLNPILPLEKGYSIIIRNGKRVGFKEVLSKNDNVEIRRKNQINKATITE